MMLLFLLLILPVSGVSQTETPPGMIRIPQSTYIPFVLKAESKLGQPEAFKKIPVTVGEFFIDRDLVTNEDFRRFLTTHPEWRRSNVKNIFADAHYLQQWTKDLEFASRKESKRPVTNVSWFAAKAYCESFEKELPTNDQWEIAFFDQGRDQEKTRERVLAWYSAPSSGHPSLIRSGGKNHFGIYDLSSLVWEWTLDFNSFLAGDELRANGGDKSNTGLFCGGGALGMLDSSDYAAFMRYSFRTSLKAAYTTGNLGFRCVKEKR